MAACRSKGRGPDGSSGRRHMQCVSATSSRTLVVLSDPELSRHPTPCMCQVLGTTTTSTGCQRPCCRVFGAQHLTWGPACWQPCPTLLQAHGPRMAVQHMGQPQGSRQPLVTLAVLFAVVMLLHMRRQIGLSCNHLAACTAETAQLNCPSAAVLQRGQQSRCACIFRRFLFQCCCLALESRG